MGDDSVVPAGNGQNVTIDGQGHTIYRGACDCQIFTLSGEGHVTFKNITIDGGALWENTENVNTRPNNGYSSGGSINMIYIDNANASATLDGGVILQNNSLDVLAMNGAAVLIRRGRLIMNSGAVIRNNSAVGSENYGGGGAVGIQSGGTFEMNGGEIYGNYASKSGGAICNEGIFSFTGGKIYKNASGNNGGGVTNDNGKMYMSGGEITENSTIVSGGGVSGLGAAELHLDGGSIYNNATSRTGSFGGGIYVGGSSKISASGLLQITENTAAGKTNNLCLGSGKTIKISSALTRGAVIGVTTWSKPTADAPIQITGENSADYSGYLRSDDLAYKIKNQENNVVWLAVKGEGDENDKGEITTDVEQGENAPAVDLATSEQELQDMLLTDSEKQKLEEGTNIRIVLDVQDAENTVSDSDRSAAEAKLNDHSMGQYLDISLYKLVGMERTNINETDGKITITITVPDSLKNTDNKKTRTFAVIRVHDGIAELLSDLDNSADTITIETDLFSTYAVVYKDTSNGGGNSGGGNNGGDNNGGDNSGDNGSNGGGSDNGGNNGGDNGSNGGAGGSNSGSSQGHADNKDTKPDSAKDKEPKTGDSTPIELCATLSMIAGMTYLLLYFADRRRGMTEETKKELVSRLIGWGKRGGKVRRYFALAAIFVLLVYYHSIGKKTCVEWEEIYGE